MGWRGGWTIAPLLSDLPKETPPFDGLVVNVSAFHEVGQGFVPWLGHKNGTDCLPNLQLGMQA